MNELIEKIKTGFESFKADAEMQSEKGNKEFRKASLEASKN